MTELIMVYSVICFFLPFATFINHVLVLFMISLLCIYRTFVIVHVKYLYKRKLKLNKRIIFGEACGHSQEDNLTLLLFQSSAHERAPGLQVSPPEKAQAIVEKRSWTLPLSISLHVKPGLGSDESSRPTTSLRYLRFVSN